MRSVDVVALDLAPADQVRSKLCRSTAFAQAGAQEQKVAAILDNRVRALTIDGFDLR